MLTLNESHEGAAANTVRLLDANVLLALVSSDHIHHPSALNWFTGIEEWATTPMVESALLRLVLNERVMGKQYSFELVRSLLVGLREQQGFNFFADDSSLCEPEMALPLLVGHRQITDLHLLNLAVRNSAVLATFDAKLRRSLPQEYHNLIEIVPVFT